MIRDIAWIIVALTVIYGAHVFRSEFVYQDSRMVDTLERAPEFKTLPQGRGLTNESWTIIRTPRASHALNLALHVVVVALTGALLWTLTGSAWTASAVAAVMALHPLTVEGVAYATSRAELLAAIGVLLALLCAVAPAVWTWAVLPMALGLAYAGKETGAVGVALLPLVLWFHGEHRWAGRLTALMASVGAVIVLTEWPLVQAWSHLGELGSGFVSPLVWLSIQTAAVGRLLILSLVPLWLSVAPDIQPLQPLAFLAAGILGLALLEVGWRLSKSAPLAAFGLAWCALVAAPRFIVRTPGSPFNEHQWYLAMVGVACVLVAGVQALASTLDRHRPLRWAS